MDGQWVQRSARTVADSVGARESLEKGGEWWGQEAAGDERPWLPGRQRTANGWGEWRGRLWTAADGVGTREWLEMGGEKKTLVMSDLGCADGCGRETGAENCADGCGRRGCNGVAGNSWGEKKPLGMSKLNWLRRRLRTGNGCGEFHGRLRTAWV